MSTAPGIMMRHILEHNYDWEKILISAIRSFQEKFCLVLFTPFASETKEIAHNLKYGVDVPDLSFKRQDIERHFIGLRWKLIEKHCYAVAVRRGTRLFRVAPLVLF
jgi:hypothetical protein